MYNALKEKKVDFKLTSYAILIDIAQPWSKNQTANQEFISEAVQAFHNLPRVNFADFLI